MKHLLPNLMLEKLRFFIMFALLVALVVTQASRPAFAQKTLFGEQEKFSEADRLRGSVTPQRQWWDLQRYARSIEVFPET